MNILPTGGGGAPAAVDPVLPEHPAFTQAQALVNQEVGSSVDARKPIEAYARVLDFGEAADDQPYHRAGAAPAPSGAP